MHSIKDFAVSLAKDIGIVCGMIIALYLLFLH